MHPRRRKLIGAIALLIFIIVYALLATGTAIVLQARAIGKAGELAYYVIAGLAWVVPAGAIIWWMQKTPPKLG
jgi:hypothetical protein